MVTVGTSWQQLKTCGSASHRKMLVASRPKISVAPMPMGELASSALRSLLLLAGASGTGPSEAFF